MLLGGIFLLLKATTELRTSGNREHDTDTVKAMRALRHADCHPDAVFADAVITAVGMVNHLPL